MFDWEQYLNSYEDLKIAGINTKEKAWKHWIRFGQKEGRVCKFINNSEYDNFNWEQYISNYEDLQKAGINNKESAWTHWIDHGQKENRNYSKIQDHDSEVSLESINKKNLFYYVGITSTQDFNTGIQRVTRNLSNMVGNYFNEYNLFLVIYCDEINDLRLLNDSELTIFCKYNGYNHNINTPINNKKKLFNLIKEEKNNITLFIPELFYNNQYDLLEKIIKQAKSKGYKTVHIYYDDTIYYNVEIEENTRIEIFNKYINTICNFDFILPISNYSKSTYLFHKNRLQLNTKQMIETILLPGEILGFERINNKTNFSDYIFSNISITERKNIGSLIKAFNILLKEYPNLKLIICGISYSDNKYYKSFKKELNNNIIFITNNTDKEISELYQNALFSVYPSINEGFGLPIYESLWYCTPVICHNATSTLEISNEINSNYVSCIDCTNINTLYLQMKIMMNKKYLKIISD